MPITHIAITTLIALVVAIVSSAVAYSSASGRFGKEMAALQQQVDERRESDQKTNEEVCRRAIAKYMESTIGQVDDDGNLRMARPIAFGSAKGSYATVWRGGMAIYDENHKIRIGMLYDQTDGPGVTIQDEHETPRVVVGCAKTESKSTGDQTKSSESALTFFDRTGNCIGLYPGGIRR